MSPKIGLKSEVEEFLNNAQTASTSDPFVKFQRTKTGPLVQARVTPEEYNDIAATAADQRETISNFIRKAAMQRISLLRRNK